MMQVLARLLACLACLLTIDAYISNRGLQGQSAGKVVVNTSLGAVRGLSKDGVCSFLAIPFAKAPVGDLRFRPPQPMLPWTDVLAGDKGFGPYCMQDYADLAASEDCLTLNVWAPSVKRRAQAKRLLPVLLFIYGGGFGEGDTAQPIYDGFNLTKAQDVLVVSVAYRLSAFGFLALPELAAMETMRGAEFNISAFTTGNMGLQDQRAGMAWAKANVAAFGGDPNRISIWGQSAGAQSVCSHLILPSSEGFFGTNTRRKTTNLSSPIPSLLPCFSHPRWSDERLRVCARLLPFACRCDHHWPFVCRIRRLQY
jgi:para-nitrobenzyl esterase